MKLIATAVLLPMLMSGCVSGGVGDCPALAAPPVAALDVLQAANSPEIDAWVLDLDGQYRKLDVCGAQ